MADISSYNFSLSKNYLSHNNNSDGLSAHELPETDKPVTFTQKLKELFSDPGIHLQRT